ncbi:DNA-processing protein DprA [Romboutsia sp. 13368]|uniref:DNA-processing protein DprA n=1 Tax=Romboutsia sp. 13368 TaxID=2708053 RepID=UPI0025E31DD5|nr:DNA-processing protein DprA [Romboutsia sp. 13368]
MENIILTLLSIPKVGRKSVDYFIRYMKEKPKNENDIVDIFVSLKNANKKIKVPTLEEVKLAREKANEIVRLSKEQNIETIDILDNKFPTRLKIIENYPQILFYKGNYNALINDYSLAIIGSREASSNSENNAYEMANYFAKETYSIVSGLALGCDTYAHKGCLDAKGMTVAVLSSGLDSIYPAQNRELAERIIESDGCLLSEYPIGFASFKNNFIERDRIESGLSLGTIVVEATVKSGTMHTANFTLQQERALICFNIPKDGNKLLLEKNNVLSINGKDDIFKIKQELEKVKNNLENKTRDI